MKKGNKLLFDEVLKHATYVMTSFSN